MSASKGFLASSALVLSALLLAGCATGPGGGGGPGGSGSSGGEGASRSPAGAQACLQDGSPWHVDTDDFAAQIALTMREQGLRVRDVVVAGAMTLEVGSGLTAVMTDGLAVEVDLDLEGGLMMQVFQNHRGVSGGAWVVDGATLRSPEAWSGEIAIDSNVVIDGQPGGESMLPPGPSDWAVPVGFECRPGELRLLPEGGIYSLLLR
jgi:hypothetical protein